MLAEQIARVRRSREIVVEEAFALVARGGGSPELREALELHIREKRILDEIGSDL